MNSRIGIGVITCNREELFVQCLASIPSVGTLVVVNDGKPYCRTGFDAKINRFIQHAENKSVCIAKNDALQYLLSKGCDYLFLIEDDIALLSDDVFDRYIKAHETTRLHHLMFGYHGSANLKNGAPSARLVASYSEKISIALNRHCVGAFTFYSRKILELVGLMDEHFNTNCWEHVDHSYRIVKAGGIPAYWWWPDIADSTSCLGEIAPRESGAIIMKNENSEAVSKAGARLFLSKHGYTPFTVPDQSPETVVSRLKALQITKESCV
ncbi:MAG: hypothetical protein JW795_00390 [Chitinivibrionales bacterium]|nr:hypothetical protein [Chitinivibrionales bacterium]